MTPLQVVELGALALHAYGIVLAFRAVLTTRTAQGSIAWSLALAFLPYIAIPLYWVFGRQRFSGYRTLRHGVRTELANEREAFLDYIEGYRLRLAPGRAIRAAEKLVAVPVLGGNDLQLLIDGAQTFASILEGIDRAEHYILVQYYIYRDDKLGTEIADRLLAAQSRGVQVYFLYDEIGSGKLRRAFIKDLGAHGIEVKPFHTRKGRSNRFQLNFRNHRKIVVVDGRVAWIGGLNVGDEYMGRDPNFGPWRDTHLRIAGPAALAAQLSFVEDWLWASGKFPELSWRECTQAKERNANVLILPSGPADAFETAALLYHSAISSAEKRLWITSPYFVPDSAVLSALQLAALRGVDVRVLIPEKADHTLVYLAAFSYLEQACKAGVRFFRYTEGFLHQKVMLVDDATAVIGTANFDNRSFRLNFEISAAVVDEPAFAKEVETMLLADFKRSREVDASDYKGRPLHFRVAVKLARVAAPLL